MEGFGDSAVSNWADCNLVKGGPDPHGSTKKEVSLFSCIFFIDALANRPMMLEMTGYLLNYLAG